MNIELDPSRHPISLDQMVKFPLALSLFRNVKVVLNPPQFTVHPFVLSFSVTFLFSFILVFLFLRDASFVQPLYLFIMQLPVR